MSGETLVSRKNQTFCQKFEKKNSISCYSKCETGIVFDTFYVATSVRLSNN